jgi:hypothetical protein
MAAFQRPFKDSVERNLHHRQTPCRFARAISRRLFHWESQSRTAEASETGQRYIHHVQRGTRVFLFVRANKEEPFVALGHGRYVRHQGERPMAIVWELEHDIPEELLRTAMLVAA